MELKAILGIVLVLFIVGAAVWLHFRKKNKSPFTYPKSKEVCFMFHALNTNIAQRYGVNAALVAQYIWEEIGKNEFADRDSYAGKTWMRSSQMMFTAVLPYLSKNMVRRALERLMRQGVIIRGEFSESCFDRTSWYAFTQFGRLLMQESEDENCE